MSGDRTTIGIGSIRAGDANGRALGRAVADGVARTGDALGPNAGAIRVGTLRVHAPAGADPSRVAEATRAQLLRVIESRRSKP